MIYFGAQKNRLDEAFNWVNTTYVLVEKIKKNMLRTLTLQAYTF